MPRLITLFAVLGTLLFASASEAQEAQYSLENRQVYAGLPFVLSVVATGFDESPEPSVGTLSIDGARVDFLGVSPDIRSRIAIINGRRSESRSVRFVYRYRVVAPEPGQYRVPRLTVRQGNATAVAEAGSFTVRDIDSTDAMKIRLGLPERPVWVGEGFEMHIDWLVEDQPGDPSFLIPLFDREDLVRVSAPEVAGRRTLEFPIGDRALELPYEVGTETVGGRRYNRFRFTAIVTPQRSGTIELDPAAVVARVVVGWQRTVFGRRPRRALAKAEDRRRTFAVKPLPVADRPISFSGAVGSSFSIAAQASRTVVRVGDPIELTLSVRGRGSLEGLRLPPLSGDHALPEDAFEVPPELPPGEAVDDGIAFTVPVRLQSKEATEIPAIPFSYFDPEAGSYVTVRTEPIALSIAGSNVVGARDVVSATRRGDGGPRSFDTVVDADLSLSAPSDTLRSVLRLGPLTPVLAALYLIPLVILAARIWQLRTRAARGHRSELQRAHRRVIRVVDEARDRSAGDSTSELREALRELASRAGGRADAELLARLETEGYRPDADRQPLDADLLVAIRSHADALYRDGRRSGGGGGASAAGAAALLVALTIPVAVFAALPDALERAREDYAVALATEDRDHRARRFAEVAEQLAELTREYPGRPELLADWGNAALGARDFGTATLAYRRALVLDPGLERAEDNLRWLRTNGPAASDADAASSAAASLFFWHRRFTPAQKHLGAAIAAAIALLLLAPLASSRSRRRLLRRLAVLPAVVVVAMHASLLLAPTPDDQVVVVDGAAILRSADSPGAPPVSSMPPGSGSEGRILDRRDGWIRVSLSSGVAGWLPEAAAEPVVARH